MPQSTTLWQKVQQQYQWFQQMQQDAPVWLDADSGCWHVFRYEDVSQVITDSTLFTSDGTSLLQAKGAKESPSVEKSLIAMDPPEHNKYRNLVSSAFTPRALARLSERVTTITQELLDQVKGRDELDLVEDLAYPLPAIVISDMLGAPAEDRPLFRRWSDRLLSQQLNDAEFAGGTSIAPDRSILEDFKEMRSYFSAMLEERLKSPRADMMSDLMAAEIDGEHLTIASAASFCVLLLIAGHVTTTNLLSQSVRCFDEHTGTMEQLHQQPELMPGAIEEVLRYASPVWRLRRMTRIDATLAGVTIPAGSMIFAWVAAANRDATQFFEPERFNFLRNPNRHVTFGHGVHFCIGAPLSRLETSIALPMILAQLPGLRQIPEKPGELFKGGFLFGFRSLPMTFDRS